MSFLKKAKTSLGSLSSIGSSIKRSGSALDLASSGKRISRTGDAAASVTRVSRTAAKNADSAAEAAKKAAKNADSAADAAGTAIKKADNAADATGTAARRADDAAKKAGKKMENLGETAADAAKKKPGFLARNSGKLAAVGIGAGAAAYMYDQAAKKLDDVQNYPMKIIKLVRKDGVSIPNPLSFLGFDPEIEVTESQPLFEITIEPPKKDLRLETGDYIGIKTMPLLPKMVGRQYAITMVDQNKFTITIDIDAYLNADMPKDITGACVYRTNLENELTKDIQAGIQAGGKTLGSTAGGFLSGAANGMGAQFGFDPQQIQKGIYGFLFLLVCVAVAYVLSNITKVASLFKSKPKADQPTQTPLTSEGTSGGERMVVIN